MTERKMHKLKETAADTFDDLDNVDIDKLTKEQFLLLGSAMAILDHEEHTQAAPTVVYDTGELLPLNEEIPSESKIEALQREFKEAFQQYGENKSEYMSHKTEDYLNIMINSLNGLLEVAREIFKNLWIGSNTEMEREAIRGFFQSYLDRYFKNK